MRSLPSAQTIDTGADWIASDELEPITPTVSSATNPNREMLKRIGQISEHSSKQIAAIVEANFPVALRRL